jgi:hypothetical protein
LRNCWLSGLSNVSIRNGIGPSGYGIVAEAAEQGLRCVGGALLGAANEIDMNAA